MESFPLYFDLLWFYIEHSIGFWITWILKKENPNIGTFPQSADLALDYIYIYIVIHRQICFVLSELISVARQYLPVAGIETSYIYIYIYIYIYKDH